MAAAENVLNVQQELPVFQREFPILQTELPIFLHPANTIKKSQSDEIFRKSRPAIPKSMTNLNSVGSLAFLDETREFQSALSMLDESVGFIEPTTITTEPTTITTEPTHSTWNFCYIV